MTRYSCAPLPKSFEAFCKFVEGATCLPRGYEESSNKVALLRAFDLLRELDVETLVLQDRVRDPDYFAEYQTYYLKQHRQVGSLCARVHAFKTVLPTPQEGQIFDAVRDVIDRATADEYVGFVTLRPLLASPVAATILQCDPQLIVPCMDTFPVHIAGVSFEVAGTPFLQQDNAVGACAQASMWMALRTQRRRTGNAAFNTAELTIAATRYLMEDRVFPGRNGLNVGQMLQAISFAGHEPAVTPIPRAKSNPWPHAHEDYKPADVQYARSVIEPYVDSGLPVILCMQGPSGKGHTVTAIGRTAHGAFKGAGMGSRVLVPTSAGDHDFVVHNDNAGPYLLLHERAVDDYGGWSITDVRLLIVPLPEGVTVSANEVQKASQWWLEKLLPPFAAGMQHATEPQSPLVARHFLVERHAFRRHMLEKDTVSPPLRELARSMDLPPWLWIYEVHLRNEYEAQTPSRVILLVFDATSDLDEEYWPLIAHFNGGLFDPARSELGLSFVTPASEGAQTKRLGPTKDDKMAMPIPPPTHSI